MNFNFSKIFERKAPVEKTEEKDKKIFEEIIPFVNNFNNKIEEARVLLENADRNSDQTTLSKIEALILDMDSNLREITELFKETKIGEDYFLTEKSEDKDSLMMAQQESLINNTPLASYSKMVRELDSFKKEATRKLMPEVSSLEN